MCGQIQLSENQTAAFYATIPGSRLEPSSSGENMGGVYSYPCDAKLAPITVLIGRKFYAIDPVDFNLGPVNKLSRPHVLRVCDPFMLLIQFFSFLLRLSGSPYCVGAISGVCGTGTLGCFDAA